MTNAVKKDNNDDDDEMMRTTTIKEVISAVIIHDNPLCPVCNDNSRVIKVGKTNTRIQKQKYFCHTCRRQFSREML